MTTPPHQVPGRFVRFWRDELPVSLPGRPPKRHHWREVDRHDAMQTTVTEGRHAYEDDERIGSFLALRGGITIPIFRDEDVTIFSWDFRPREPNWGEGRYVFRDGDWVRP